MLNITKLDKSSKHIKCQLKLCGCKQYIKKKMHMFMLNYATFCGCMQQLKQNNQSLLILKKYSKNMCQEANFSKKYAN